MARILISERLSIGRNFTHQLELSLHNSTTETLGGLRLQICNMLKGMAGFTEPNEDNLIKHPPYGACRSADGRRWLITAWQPSKYIWINPAVPCFHCDPQLPDCGRSA